MHRDPLETSPGQGTSRAGRLEGIEGIRGLAATMVVVAHSAVNLHAGDHGSVLREILMLGLHGVTIFFVLSGFLLFRPFAAAALDGRLQPRRGPFWRNRALRIAPAYVVIFTITCVILPGAVTSTISHESLQAPFTDQVGRMTDPVLVLSNLLLVQGYFPAGVNTGLSASWSLGPEVMFYILLPLIGAATAWLGSKLSRPAALIVVPLGLVVIGEATRLMVVLPLVRSSDADRVIGQMGGSWSAVLYRGFLVNCGLFGIGMLTCVVLLTWGATHPARARQLFTGCLVVGALAFPLSMAVDGEFAAGLATSGLVGRLLLARNPGDPIVLLLRSRTLSYLGRISYSMYLWHLPLVHLALDHGTYLKGGSAALAANCIIVLVITVALSHLTYRWVEAPALRRKTAT